MQCSPTSMRRAGYAGRAWALFSAGKVTDNGHGNYLVAAVAGGHHHVCINGPSCDCIEFQENRQTHQAALAGKRVVSPGLTCTHIVACRAFRGDFDLVEEIKKLPGPLLSKARMAARYKLLQFS